MVGRRTVLKSCCKASREQLGFNFLASSCSISERQLQKFKFGSGSVRQSRAPAIGVRGLHVVKAQWISRIETDSGMCTHKYRIVLVRTIAL